MHGQQKLLIEKCIIDRAVTQMILCRAVSLSSVISSHITACTADEASPLSASRNTLEGNAYPDHIAYSYHSTNGVQLIVQTNLHDGWTSIRIAAESAVHPPRPISSALLGLGDIIISSAMVKMLLEGGDDLLVNLLWRHAMGDWGNISLEDKAKNYEALKTRGRLFSEYTVQDSSHEMRIAIATDLQSLTTMVTLLEKRKQTTECFCCTG